MTETTEDEFGEGEEDKKVINRDLPLVIDEGVFVHQTGDKYEGTFEAKKKDRTAKMQGPGSYITAEGDIYTGVWDNDRLGYGGTDVKITYTDGSRYEGLLKDWNYSGRGRYTYPDNSTLMCDFSESCPTGALTLMDPNGHVWLGRADTGFGWFDPVNHYYHMLEKTRESRSMNKATKVTPPVKAKPPPKSPHLNPKSGKKK